MSTAAEIAEQAGAWYEENWDSQLTLAEWWERLGRSGWAFPSWPEGYGGKGLPRALAKAAIAERARRGAFGPPSGIATFLAAPTILAYGTDDQKRRLMDGIVTGRDVWCQLFSEPGAGSDMASLQTRAERDGDEWVVSGQKVWNSGAQHARYAILIARTDPSVPKHRGLTYFLIDMHQPGVDVRPLREMTGDAAFNEVFLDGARVPDANRLGEVGEGWRVAMTTLSHERDPDNSGMSHDGGASMGHVDTSLTVAEYRARRDDDQDGFSLALGGGISEMLNRIMRDFGATKDPALRQQLMRVYTLRQVIRWSSQRAAAAAKAGRQPGPEISTLKLAGSQLGRMIRDLGWQAMGAHATLIGPDAPTGGAFHKYALFTPAMSIAGGS
ncbi:MAG: acyl-CoA dehydrogenase family protein, partial [Acidimicrobiia bacterium]|nr:acyl-CoA dehydrogenase family protein [Acidimicrobiia bacterium]